MSIKSTKRHYTYRLYNFSGYAPEASQLTLWYNSRIVATDSVSGTDMPLYKQVIKSGGNANNNLVATRSRVIYRKGHIASITKSTEKGPQITCWSEAILPYPYVNTRTVNQALVDDADNIARIEVIKKIRQELGSYEGPVVLGELAETIKWIKSPAKTLRIAFYNFFESHERKLGRLSDQLRMEQIKRNKRKLIDRYSKDLADNFMELTFAVRPLIGTISDIAEAALFTVPGRSLKRLSATIPREASTVKSNGFSSIGTGQTWVSSHDIAQVDRVLVNYVVWYKEEIPYIADILERVISSGQFNLSGIPMTAWELFPLSWLYDYFANIGDLLACNFDYNAHIAFAKKSVTKDVIDYSLNHQFKKSGNSIWVSGSCEPPYMLTYTRSFVRTKLDNLGNSTPSFSFSLPGSTDQFLNMAGLARQKFDKCFNKWRTVRI